MNWYQAYYLSARTIAFEAYYRTEMWVITLYNLVNK